VTIHPPLDTFGGAGHTIHFAAANGFPPRVYTPMLSRLTGHGQVMALAPRPLWGEPPPQMLYDWRDGAARDLLDGLAAHDLREVIAVGHSYGGIATLLAALDDPSRFKALVLLDPTILTRDVFAGLAMLREAGMSDQMPLAIRARKRERHFADVQAAFGYFRGKALFGNWDDAALQHYVEHGTEPAPDGGLMLRWSPEWEAYVFETGYTATWEALPRLHNLLPTLIIRGGDSDTYLAESAAEVAGILPEATHREIAAHGHLFPLTAPAQTAQLIADFLATLD